MFRRTKVCSGLMLAFGGTLAMSVAPVFAQQQLERVEITGSSIKRIAAEGALPVITLTRKDIEQSGATSVRELVQALPSMQGFTYSSDSVNGGGGGTTTASLRNLGSVYTLVLLNGRRVAPFNTGSTVNLEQLPLSSVDRVEILADGASTLYGADAIAGVVNFITRKNSTTGGIDISVSKPQRAGGGETQASVSKGFGNLDSDGFNVLAGLSIEKEDKIKATDRKFSKSGIVPFTHDGRALYLYQVSANSNPPNVLINDGVLGFYNPVRDLTGNCGSDPAALAPPDGTCRYDFASTVEAQPEAERKNLFLSGQFKLNKDLTAFGEALISDTSMTARFAPPAQPLPMAIGGVLYNRYVAPTLAGQGILPADVTDVTYLMRLSDAGLRANEYRTKAQHLVVGVEGSVLSFDGSVSYTHSTNTQDDKNVGGYSSLTRLNQLIDSDQFDPFAQGTAASKAAVAPAVLNEIGERAKSTLDVASLKASRPVFELPGGSSYVGFGADLMKQSYSETPSPIYQGPNAFQPTYSDFPVGSGNGQVPFDTSRKSRGIYAELQMPITKELELTGSLRHDGYDAAKNSLNFDSALNPIASAEQGNSASKTTYKLGVRFQPMPELLLRASVGTGFRAPTLKDITEPLADFGVIGTQRACPVGPGDPLFAGCRPLPTQWRKLKGGNPFTGQAGLKPENSDQWSVGVRFEPNASVSTGFDLWSVKVKDVITVLPEDTAFDSFALYRSAFSVTIDPATNSPIFTFNETPINGAVAKSTGIDFDVTIRSTGSLGKFTGQISATYLIDSYFDYGFGGGKESSLGKLGSDDQVAFRTLLRLQGTLETGAFTNTLTLFWKPGYMDQTYTAADATIFLRNPDGTRGAATSIDGWRVPSFTTVDWQGRWAIDKAFGVTAGVKNLFDRQAPLSIKTVAGNMVGFDPRYADGKGRTIYLSGSYRF